MQTEASTSKVGCKSLLHASTGKSATDHVSNTAAKWALDKFRQECAVPPSKVAERVHVLIACRKLPVYIGGLYRKLDR